MYELPLFPLQTVLFPGIPLRLHIFEERYKQMINLCLDSQTPFGVVLIQRGAEAFGPVAEPYLIGCTADVAEVQKLPDGRMNLIAVGRDRFRILSLKREVRPYLIGEVETYPLPTPDTKGLASAGKCLWSWVERYVNVLAESGRTQVDLDQFPEDTLGMAYMAAALVQAPPDRKQEVLSATDAFDLIDRICDLYRREVVLLKTMLVNKGEIRGSFSRN